MKRRWCVSSNRRTVSFRKLGSSFAKTRRRYESGGKRVLMCRVRACERRAAWSGNCVRRRLVNLSRWRVTRRATCESVATIRCLRRYTVRRCARLEGGRRYGTLEDFQRLVKITHMLPSLHHSGFVTCEPCDVPVSKRHLDMVFTHMTCTDKPHLGAITEMSRAEESVAMARILHGDEIFDNHCVIMGNVNTNSPLLVDKVVTEAIRTYSAAGQGMIVAPFILGGAMGPVTTAASIACLAKTMMCCYFYNRRPGSPPSLAASCHP